MLITLRYLDMTQQRPKQGGGYEPVVTEYDILFNTEHMVYAYGDRNGWSTCIKCIDGTEMHFKHTLAALHKMINSTTMDITPVQFNPETTVEHPVVAEEPVKKGPFGRPIKSGTTSAALE